MKSGMSFPEFSVGTLAGWPVWLCIVLLSFAWLFYSAELRRLRRQLQKLSALELKVSALEQLNHQLQSSLGEQSHENHELRVGALALGQRLNELEFNLSEFMASQQNTEQLEPEGRLYRRAVRMVELGADLDEIIQECELPSAEAELIYRLHRQKS